MAEGEMKNTSKKKQHYVPKMIQTRFSNDGKRVSVWDIHNRRTFKDIGLREQLQEKYFYEKTEDGIEHALEVLESIAGPLFDQIEDSTSLPPKGSEDWKLLIMWMVVQVQRTDKLASPINQFSQEMIRRVLTELEADGEFPEGPDGLGAKDIGIKIDPKWGRRHAVALAFETAGTAEDLRAGILHSPNGRVILPDTGALRFNLIAEEGGLPWGWASVGAGALLPISNRTAVVFFDPCSYTWMENFNQVYKVMDETDETALAETLLLRSSNRVVFNTDPDWIVRVDTDLHVKCSGAGTAAIVIPGLTPHASLLELARDAQTGLFGPPPRPTANLG